MTIYLFCKASNEICKPDYSHSVIHAYTDKEQALKNLDLLNEMTEKGFNADLAGLNPKYLGADYSLGFCIRMDAYRWTDPESGKQHVTKYYITETDLT